MTQDRPYIYKDAPKIPNVDAPKTRGGLGRGRSAIIEFQGKSINVRLHKYTNSVCSDKFGNVYLETGGRYKHGTFIRTWIREVEK